MEIPCPHCTGTRLREERYEGCLIHRCPHCRGAFVATGDMPHIVAAREAALPPEVLAATAGVGPSFGLPPAARERAVACPCCSTSMTVVNYAGDSGVAVDRCDRACGLWLDGDELERIQALLERWEDEARRRRFSDIIRGAA